MRLIFILLIFFLTTVISGQNYFKNDSLETTSDTSTFPLLNRYAVVTVTVTDTSGADSLVAEYITDFNTTYIQVGVIDVLTRAPIQYMEPGVGTKTYILVMPLYFCETLRIRKEAGAGVCHIKIEAWR